MHLLRVLDLRRILMGLGLIGLLAVAGGCDGAGGGGESSVAPATPPPGKSTADQAKDRANSHPVGAAAAKKLGSGSVPK
jgi:hypothetical protein